MTTRSFCHVAEEVTMTMIFQEDDLEFPDFMDIDDADLNEIDEIDEDLLLEAYGLADDEDGEEILALREYLWP